MTPEQTRKLSAIKGAANNLRDAICELSDELTQTGEKMYFAQRAVDIAEDYARRMIVEMLAKD